MKPGKAQTWYKVRLEVPPLTLETEAAFWAERWGGFQVEKEGEKIELSFFLSGLEALKAFKEEIKEFPILAVETLPEEDWGEGWKEHFHPLKVSPRFWVSPPWEKVSLSPGERALIIDPGQAFGTGHHPTTALMLYHLDRFWDQKRPQTVLDVGCGTGILALAAASLGASKVVALDIDPEALKAARHNARLNRLKIEITDRPLEELEGQFELILCNISAWELKRLSKALVSRLAPQGHLFIAGFLSSEGPELQEIFETLGLKKACSEEKEEWGFLAFSR